LKSFRSANFSRSKAAWIWETARWWIVLCLNWYVNSNSKFWIELTSREVVSRRKISCLVIRGFLGNHENNCLPPLISEVQKLFHLALRNAF
jgi:hypothetical protein